MVHRTVLALSAALLVAGCGDVADDGALAEPAEPAETTADDDSGDADPGVLVAVASTDLGDVLVDGDGMTLYMFEPDDQGPSVCEDDCAEAWPPLVTDGEAAAGDGAQADLLGMTERGDGSTQLTYDGWPLYHWAGDQAPGDVAGQGVNDVWWVIAPDGTPQRDAADAGDVADGDDDGDGGVGPDY